MRNYRWTVRLLLITILSFAYLMTLSAQELRCTVRINAGQVQTQERQVISTLEKSISDFMNNSKWTDHDYEESERIKCNLQITLDKNTKIENNQYVGNVQVQYSRPVYKTNYESLMMNFLDQSIAFSYRPNDPLIYTPNSRNTGLTLLLAYYAYAILALDYDSFSPLGGKPYVEEMLNIINNAQTSNVGGRGWVRSQNKQERYWIMEDMNNPQFATFREDMYKYHRLGVDLLREDPQKAQANIFEVIQNVKELQRVQPNAMLLRIFVESKSEELYNIFGSAERSLRTQAADILMNISPTKASLFRELKN
ncbi:MAG: DUF4835 family protein [Bernardetiaceae bacterium]|nr:DUF4835 family protein [Bernardetiaceae bacterium]